MQPPKTCMHVDLRRYAGVWYEIARLPNFFEKDGCYDVQARYTLQTDGQALVENSCMYRGKEEHAKGIARAVGPGKLHVSFLPLFLSFFWMGQGNYWILATDHTSYSLVGDPERKHLWILSRKPQMDYATYAHLVQTAAADGFDVSGLQLVRHSSHCCLFKDKNPSLK